MPPPDMAAPVKLLDDSMHWCDNALEVSDKGACVKLARCVSACCEGSSQEGLFRRTPYWYI